jgi:ribosome maturation factor RimP
MAQRGRGAAAGARSGQQRPPAGKTQARAAGGPPVDLVALRARVRGVVEPVVAGIDLDLEELTVARAGSRYVVRVTVDGDGGVTHDDLTDTARAISAGLDQAEEDGGELMPGAYTLEVSSPGVDRPLSLPRHWRRNVSRLVTVRIAERSVTGRITATDDTTVTLDVDGTARVVPFADLGPGRVQVEFNRLAEAEFAADEYDESQDDEFDDTDEHGAKRRDGEVGR